MGQVSELNRIRNLKRSLKQFPDIPPPSPMLFALECRSIWEIWTGMFLAKPTQLIAPKGDDHPVLVLPGLGMTDTSTRLVRNFLNGLGYDAYGWGLGRNKGYFDETHDGLIAELELLNEIYEEKVSVIGQSLGGVYAREVARSRPDLIRQVITMGTPFTGHPLASTIPRAYELLSGGRLDDIDFDRHLSLSEPLEVPSTSMYSMLDGIVAWKCSIESDSPISESIHIRGHSHIGMASSPLTLWLVAERLAQPAGQWTPYKARGLDDLFFGTRDHKLSSRA